jgi:hypothetical protein
MHSENYGQADFLGWCCTSLEGCWTQLGGMRAPRRTNKLIAFNLTFWSFPRHDRRSSLRRRWRRISRLLKKISISSFGAHRLLIQHNLCQRFKKIIRKPSLLFVCFSCSSATSNRSVLPSSLLFANHRPHGNLQSVLTVRKLRIRNTVLENFKWQTQARNWNVLQGFQCSITKS